jgi:hypothetical protein
MIFRDLRAFRLYDGPTEVHKYAIAREVFSLRPMCATRGRNRRLPVSARSTRACCVAISAGQTTPCATP